MINLILIGVLLGALFSRVFKVWILFPACLAAFAAIFARSAYFGEPGMGWTLLECAMLAMALQIGYAASLFLALIPPFKGRSTASLAHPDRTPPAVAARHRHPF